jgi:hypothetical protein
LQATKFDSSGGGFLTASTLGADLLGDQPISPKYLIALIFTVRLNRTSTADQREALERSKKAAEEETQPGSYKERETEEAGDRPRPHRQPDQGIGPLTTPSAEGRLKSYGDGARRVCGFLQSSRVKFVGFEGAPTNASMGHTSGWLNREVRKRSRTEHDPQITSAARCKRVDQLGAGHRRQARIR